MTPSSIPPACIQCGLENTYTDTIHFICPDCGHEWPAHGADDADDGDSNGVNSGDDDAIVRDSNGAILATGDAVILIKDLKVKGSSVVLKKGTKIKSIRIADGGAGHDVDCKTDQGSFMLKSEFLKKA